MARSPRTLRRPCTSAPPSFISFITKESVALKVSVFRWKCDSNSMSIYMCVYVFFSFIRWVGRVKVSEGANPSSKSSFEVTTNTCYRLFRQSFYVWSIDVHLRRCWFRRSPFHGWVLWFSTSLFWASIPFWEVLIHGNGWSACTGWFWVLVLEDTGVTSKPDILKHDWYKLERLRLWGKLSVVQHPFFDSDNMLIWELSVEFGIW